MMNSMPFNLDPFLVTYWETQLRRDILAVAAVWLGTWNYKRRKTMRYDEGWTLDIIQGGDYVPVRQTEAVLRLFLRLWPKNFIFIEILCLSSWKTHFCLIFPPQAPYHGLKHHVSTNLSCTQQFWVSSAAWRLQLRLFHEKILVQYPLRP